MAKTELKDRVVAYRNDGLSYKEIAEKTNVSVDYARAIYSRARRKDNSIISDGPDGTCRYCGEPLQYIDGKKKKLFCCQKCSDDFRYQKKKREPYVLVCELCGHEFVAYGNPNKRFCSRECQTLAGRKG